MGLWLRVFGKSTNVPEAEGMRNCLSGVAPVTATFDGDEGGWLRAEICFGEAAPLLLERFLSDEEGIRAELNNWAAYLETCDYEPNHAPLMERMIQTKQLFTLRRPIDHADEVLVDRLCVALCRFLATATDGVYQVDDAGFCAADGTLLLREY
jgi:hypothetical protein